MNCKNCQTELQINSDFCYSCGGKVIRNRLTFKNLFEHISETFFNYDNKLLRTIIDLFKKPEEVIGGYINGIRKRYVNPISFFGLTLTIVSLEWFILQKFFPHLMNMASISPNGDETFASGLFEVIQKYGSILMMLYVPLYAIISRVVFFDKKTFNYTEHVVAYIYILSVISLLGAVLNILCVLFGYDLGVISYVNLLVQVLYISYCFKRLYQISTGEIIGRTFISFFVYMILYVIVVALIFIIIYFVDGKETIIEIIKSFMPKKS
ncbi:DUF3667 domain-containing protein [Psychroserpens sp. MEBiC05023]